MEIDITFCDECRFWEKYDHDPAAGVCLKLTASQNADEHTGALAYIIQDKYAYFDAVVVTSQHFGCLMGEAP